MPLSFFETLSMHLRGSPVAKIRKALAQCEAAGVAITAADLEAHSLCGGDPLILAEALVTALKLGVETSYSEISAVCIAGCNPLELVQQSTHLRALQFETLSPDGEDRLRGMTQDRTPVTATVRAEFRLSPMDLGVGHSLKNLQERLSIAVMLNILAAPDYPTLELRRCNHEAELRRVGTELIRGLLSVEVVYRREFGV